MRKGRPDLFGLRVKSNLSSQQHRDLAKMPDRSRPVRSLGRAGRLMASLYAVKELSLMPWASEVLDLVRADRFVQNALLACLESSAIHARRLAEHLDHQEASVERFLEISHS